MPSGTVKSFDDNKGLGFIGQNDGSEDLFVHFSSIQTDGFKTLSEGQRVSYEVTRGPKGMQAAEVQPLAEGAAGTGTVKWFNDKKGLGFIQPDGGGNADIFVHHSSIDMDGFRTLSEGQRVSYEVTRGPKGMQATVVKPLAEGDARAGDDNIQRETDSPIKVFTAVFENEPKLTTTKAHADSADSEYEASEESADDASIFSLPDSLSSKSSLHDLLGPTEEFAAMLINDAELSIQYQSLHQIFEFSEFKSELHRLLKVFSRNLSKEASIPIEKESVRFISQQRRRISQIVGQEVFGLKEKSLFNENSQQQLDAKERIERFLRDAAQSKGVDEEQSSAGREQSSESDSSDEEGELENFPSLMHIKKFLIESKAFEKLRSSIRQLAVHQGNKTSRRLDTGFYQGLKQPESSTTMKSNENEELSLVNSVEEERGSQTFNKDIETEEIRGSSNFSPSLKESRERFGSQSTIGDEPDDHTYLTSMGRMIYWKVSCYLRPRVKAGYIRLEWQCVSRSNF
jgi:cold shock CspA family protein